MIDDELKSKWPSIGYAYDFVIPSYQWMMARFEAADSRIQTLQTFIVTVTFGSLAMISATSDKDNLNFKSWPFIAAMIIAAAAVIMGAIGRLLGGTYLVNPGIFYERWLHKSESEFKKDMLYFPGEHFVKNSLKIRNKSIIGALMTLLFLSEMVLLFLWITHE